MESLIELRRRLTKLEDTLAELERERVVLVNEIARRLRQRHGKSRIFLVHRPPCD